VIAPADATDELTVTSDAPTVQKQFDALEASSIVAGGTSTLTVVLTNPNAIALTGAAISDTYPAGSGITNSAVAITDCGGTLTSAVGGNDWTLVQQMVAVL